MEGERERKKKKKERDANLHLTFFFFSILSIYQLIVHHRYVVEEVRYNGIYIYIYI